MTLLTKFKAKYLKKMEYKETPAQFELLLCEKLKIRSVSRALLVNAAP
jgi:hypothetical protein